MYRSINVPKVTVSQVSVEALSLAKRCKTMAGARVAGLLAMLVAITAQPLGYSFLDVSRLRAHILNQGSKIDSIVPPPQDVDGVGLPVKMQIRVFKIISVDMPTATMRLQIWRRMKWKDTRLAWNETEFGGAALSKSRLLPQTDKVRLGSSPPPAATQWTSRDCHS